MDRLGGVLVVLLLGCVGCDGDFADGSGASDTDGSPDTAQGESTTGVLPGSEDSTGQGGLEGTGNDSDTDDGPASPDACEDFVCGPHGLCDAAGDTPVCVCDAGYASTGLDCLRCAPTQPGLLPAEVPTARAAFAFTFDGNPASTSGFEFARITLHNPDSGDVVRVGDTNESPTVLMVPGIYEVRYEFREGALPRNSASVLQYVHVPPGDVNIPIDVQTTTLKGQVTLAGGGVSAPGLNYGRVFLFDPVTEDRIALATTQDDGFEVRVTPGRYEVHYEFRESQGEAPTNRDAFVQAVELLPGSQELSLDVPVAKATGRILVDGEANPSGFDSGDLELRDPITGDRFPLASTQDPSYEVTLVPGSYEIVYTLREPGPRSPVNRGTVAGFLSLDPGLTEHDINLVTATLSGDFTVAGEAPPTDNFDDGIVVLRDAGGGEVSLGNTRSGPYSRRVLAGEYDVVYAQETASLTMPVNTQARIQTITVRSDTVLNIDIPVVEIVGTITIDGEAAPDSPYDDGRLFLRNPETGDSALLGNTREGSYAARIIPGTYNLVYSNEFSDTVLPVNRGAILTQGVTLDGATSVDIDVPVSVLEGNVGLQNARPSPSEGIGQLFLRDVATHDTVFLGGTNAPGFTKPVTAGTYLMEYRGIPAQGATLGTSLPANENAAFACFELVSD